MKVTLLNYTPLEIAIQSIRTCWDSNDLSDNFGPKDTKLLETIVKSRHLSTLEHIFYNFKIQGISRACLQELARHRIASFSVKSSRYTLRELLKNNTQKTENEFLREFLVPSSNEIIDSANIETLKKIKILLQSGVKNDVVKYLLPEAYKVDLHFSINCRALLNLLELRLANRAHFEIRELAKNLLSVLPQEHAKIYEIYASEK